jgi:hypothetical protein
MGRLAWATPEVAYAADLNDLAVALWNHDKDRHGLMDVLTPTFGPPPAADQKRSGPPSPLPETANLQPVTPAAFDALFGG